MLYIYYREADVDASFLYGGDFYDIVFIKKNKGI